MLTFSIFNFYLLPFYVVQQKKKYKWRHILRMKFDVIWIKTLMSLYLTLHRHLLSVMYSTTSCRVINIYVCLHFEVLLSFFQQSNVDDKNSFKLLLHFYICVSHKQLKRYGVNIPLTRATSKTTLRSRFLGSLFSCFYRK